MALIFMCAVLWIWTLTYGKGYCCILPCAGVIARILKEGHKNYLYGLTMKDKVYHVEKVFLEGEKGLVRIDQEFIVKNQQSLEELRQDIMKDFKVDKVYFTYEVL